MCTLLDQGTSSYLQGTLLSIIYKVASKWTLNPIKKLRQSSIKAKNSLQKIEVAYDYFYTSKKNQGCGFLDIKLLLKPEFYEKDIKWRLNDYQFTLN